MESRTFSAERKKMNHDKGEANNVAQRWDRWRETYQALRETYFTEATFGHLGEVPANGNYMLAGLLRYEQRWNALHGHRGVSQSTLDSSAAHEIRFLFNRSYRPTRVAAALSACIGNLVTERPERILERHDRRMKAAEKKRAQALAEKV